MKKRLIFEVEEGKTPGCDGCPFNTIYKERSACGILNIEDIDCDEYNLTTLKFIGEES